MKKTILTLIALLTFTTLQAQTNILVTYFSWSNSTKALAEEIASQTNADLYRIEPATPYTTDYNTLAYTISNAEKEANARPALKETDKNFSQYKYIFIGCPVWWFDAPMIIHTFLENYDFKGKTIIPFCTYATAEYQTLNDIINATPDSNHLDGFGTRGSSRYNSSTIAQWLERIGIANVAAGIDGVLSTSRTNDKNIYHLDGRIARRDFTTLSAGVYVVGGRKIIKK